MPEKPLYQQAIEVYKLQKTLTAYGVENDYTFLKWYHNLSSRDQQVLHESTQIVARFAKELTETLSEFFQTSGVLQIVFDKFFPGDLLSKLNINLSNHAVELPNESDDYAASSEIIPDDTEFDQERKNLLEQSLEMYLRQQVSGITSFSKWHSSLGTDDKRILIESLQSALALTDDITRTFSDVVYNFVQSTKEEVESKLLPIQELCKQE